MTDDYKRGYSRGYWAGSRGAWPDHLPPAPPDDLIAELMAAAHKLRDAVDGELATLDKDDPWQTALGDGVDAVDEAMTAISSWLKGGGDA